MTGPRRPDGASLVARLRDAGYVVPTAHPKIEWFGNEALAHELGDLVRRGVKRASAGLMAAWEADGDPLPQVGDVEIIIDWDGEAMAVVEVTDVRVQRFDDVDEAFARDEGEGDATLTWWRDAHRRFFLRECARLGIEWSPALPIVCRRFRLLYAVARRR
jgi:uncharacterized protein YhfF